MIISSDTYGWDQSDKFVKIYITSGLKEVKEVDVSCNFTDRSFELAIRSPANNTTQLLTVINLLNQIDSTGSYTKVKPDMVTVFLKKVELGRNWGYVTAKEAILKDKKEKTAVPKIDENADPQDGLMSLMKKMYEEGDDEMKRTISKAFIEGREKKEGGGGADMMGGGMGGMANMMGGMMGM